MNTVNVYEQPLPGLGRRFDIILDTDHTLSVVALRDGHRQLTRHSGGDSLPTVVLDLDRDQAATIGALLLGAQFSLNPTGDVEPADRVVVDTITVTGGASAIGKTPDDALLGLGTDIVVLAVIRDHTPELVEHDPQLELGEGDRVAVAARRSHHHLVTRALTGR